MEENNLKFVGWIIPLIKNWAESLCIKIPPYIIDHLTKLAYENYVNIEIPLKLGVFMGFREREIVNPLRFGYFMGRVEEELNNGD